MTVCRFALAVSTMLASFATASAQEQAGWRSLFNGCDLEGWNIWLGRPMSGQFLHDRNPEPVFEVVEEEGEPALFVSGRIWGGLMTDDEFGDFHFRAQFKWKDAEPWPPLTWRDAGILYHTVGEPGMAHIGHASPLGETATPGPLSIPEGAGIYTECLEYQMVGDVDSKRFGYRDDRVGQFVYFGRAVGDLQRFEPRNQFPAGEWNLIEIVCLGQKARHYLNGKLVAVVTNTRFIEGDRERPLTRGRIQLQSESGEVFFRRLELRSIDTFDIQVGVVPPSSGAPGPVPKERDPRPNAPRSKPAVPSTDSRGVSSSEGWQPLLKGDDLSGWQIYLGWPMEGQFVSDGNPEPVFEMTEREGEPVLRVSGRIWGTLATESEFENFHLRAEFRWGANHVWPPLTWRESGVMYHAFGPPNAAVLGSQQGGPFAEPPGSGLFPESMEYELAHPGPSDQEPRLRECGRAYSRGRVRFDIVHERPRDQLGPDQWNLLEIRCVADESRHDLNGVEIARLRRIRIEGQDDSRPLKRGRICIQSESTEFFIRRMEIRPITDFDSE